MRQVCGINKKPVKIINRQPEDLREFAQFFEKQPKSGQAKKSQNVYIKAQSENLIKNIFYKNQSDIYIKQLLKTLKYLKQTMF